MLPEDSYLREQAELSSNLLTPLQKDAIQLALELLKFIERLGPEPAPMYTKEQIERMSSAESKRLIEAQDGDYLEACEYHFGDGHLPLKSEQGLQNAIMANMNRLWPWYEKVRASYALEWKGEIEKMWNRFSAEGLADDGLLLPVDGRDGIKSMRAIAAKLWELAYKLRAKEIHIEDHSVRARLEGKREIR